MMTIDEINQRFDAAKIIAREAGLFAHRERNGVKSFSKKRKIDGTWATDIDDAVENFVISEIKKKFPADNIFSEEAGGKFSDCGWIIDPIDGTGNFIYGLPHWCVSIAFMAEGDIALGAIYLPAEEKLFAARRGSGSFCNDHRLHTNFSNETLAGAVIGIALTRQSKPVWLMPHIEALIKQGASIRALGSGGTALALVAEGKFNVFLERGLHIWDCAAAIIIIKEAGGWVHSGFDPQCPGRSFDFMAGSGGIEEKMLALGIFR